MTPIRSRTNSLSSNSSILTNAANLLTDTPNEYSYLDSTKVNAFMNEIHTPTKVDGVIPSPTKAIRKRRLTIEYPFPFLVEQAKKQRVTPKKLQEELAKQTLLPRPLSPEYEFSPFDDPLVDSTELLPIVSFNNNCTETNVTKRQRAIDFRHLQSNMHHIISKNFQDDQDLVFSEIFPIIHPNDQRSSSDVGICFAALLNNAVRYQLVLESNDIRDDIRISPPKLQNQH